MQVYMKLLKVVIMINMNMSLPEITLDKNLFYNENLGSLNVQTNYKVHNYDTNKVSNFISK